MPANITALKLKPMKTRGLCEIHFEGTELLEDRGEFAAYGLIYLLYRLDQGFFLINAATQAPLYFSRTGAGIVRHLKSLHPRINLEVISK